MRLCVLTVIGAEFQQDIFPTVASGAYAGTYPDLTSFVLASNSSASTSTPGTYEEFVVTSDLTPTPEPGSIVLTLTGFAFVALRLQTMRSRTA